mmetsp:Transcript_31746/g.95019  ORF Transcript_31746/g.95019 Transcript_31746/m.95019 type:complete len:105 (-) Transcript_31746:531-845(-)
MNEAEKKATVKDASREGRLSFRNFAEHQMRREFKETALEKCRDHVAAFGQCAQENGLLVVFKCRQINKELNECMSIYNSHEAFETYKEAHRDELEGRTIRSKNN